MNLMSLLSLYQIVDTELCRKLRLVKGLVEDGKPYKKILREKYGYVA